MGGACGRCLWAVPVGGAWAVPVDRAYGRCLWAVPLGGASGRCLRVCGDLLEDDVLDVGENDSDALQEDVDDVRLHHLRLLVLAAAAIQREAEVDLCNDDEHAQIRRHSFDGT